MKSFKEYIKESEDKPFFNNGKDVAVFEYISPRERNLTPDEAKIRDVSYALKKPNKETLEYAAPLMAKFVKTGSVLVPIPSSKGDTQSNLLLAQKIAQLSNSSVLDALIRKKIIPSSATLRRLGKQSVKPEDHQFVIRKEVLDILDQSRKKVVFVDNVITSGATINAARNAFNDRNLKSISFAKAKNL